jgi:hypothetical protein
MKLKTVSTYQTVRFNKHDERHFDSAIPRFAGIEMEFDEKNGFVKLELPDKDIIYVFPTNIAYIVPLPTESVKKTK